MKLLPTLGIVGLILLIGCGGSGGSGGSTGTTGNVITSNPSLRVAVNVGWGGQTGTFTAPANAQSAAVFVSWQDPIGPIPTQTFNKSASPAAYSQTVQIPANIGSGLPCGLNAYFYAQPDAQGPIIASASSRGSITAEGVFVGQNGQPLGQLATTPAQPVPVVYNDFTSIVPGTPLTLQFWMEDQFNQVSAKNPPGGVWTLVEANNVPPSLIATLTANGVITGIGNGLVGLQVAYQGQASQVCYVYVGG